MNRALLLLCILLAPPGAHAQTPKTVFLEDLTWTELQDQVRSGKTSVIVPVGGTEQNGPHIALGKHNMRVKALSEKSRSRWAMRWWRRCWLTFRKAACNRRRHTCAFPGRSPCRAKRLKRFSSTRHEASSFMVFGISCSWGPRGLSGERQGGRGTAEPGMGRDARCGRMPSRNTTGLPKPNMCRRSSTGVFATGKLARTPASPTPRSCSRWIRVRCGWIACNPAQSPAPPTAYTAIPRRASAELGQLGVDAVVARTVAAIPR